jgi:hypothetical protein
MKKFGTKSIKACGCGKSSCDVCGWFHFSVVRDTKDWELGKGDFTIDFWIDLPYEIVWWSVNKFMYNRFLKRN